MAIHPKLTDFSDAKYIKAFNKYLKGIEKELEKLGTIDYNVEVQRFGPRASFMNNFISAALMKGYRDPEEALIIEAEVHGCPVEVAVPISKRKIEMPYFITIHLQAPMTGEAEFRRGKLRNKWHLDPDDKGRAKELKKSLPKVTMKQIKAEHNEGIVYKIAVGYSLKPTESGNTEWIINSGYEGGVLKGRYRPRVRKYLESIPTVEALLQKWNDDQ